MTLQPFKNITFTLWGHLQVKPKGAKIQLLSISLLKTLQNEAGIIESVDNSRV